MVVSLFGLVLVSGALIRLIVLHPLPLAAGLMAGHAALVAGAGPFEAFGAFALAVTGVSASCRPPRCAGMAIRTCWIFDWAQGRCTAQSIVADHRATTGFVTTGLRHGNRPTIRFVLTMVCGFITAGMNRAADFGLQAKGEG